MTKRAVDLVLEPATGKALPLLRGELLEIEQLGDGQCVDLNVFNLHDSKERFDAARTRMMHGVCPTKGAMLWSNPPRDRPLLSIVSDTVGRNDVLFPACSGFEYEYFAGFERHTNCQEILAEAMREYALTPDDVHDPFNLWLESGVDEEGMLYSRPVSARRGDSTNFLAQVDVLAVVSVCGDDLFGSSQFEMKPVRVVVAPAVEEVRRRWLLPERPSYRNQRAPSGFRQAAIRVTRELKRDTSFIPRWEGYPVRTRAVEIELPEDARGRIQLLRESGRFGETDGEIVRAVLFHWWQETQIRSGR